MNNVMFILAYCFVLHFLADFILQSREMGKKKSSEFSWLARHIFTQIYVFTLGLLPFVGPGFALTFALLNGLMHAIIDWNIWKAYKVLVYYRIQKNQDHELLAEDPYDKANPWKYWEDHWFYATIGFDQLLHSLTIIVLFCLFI